MLQIDEKCLLKESFGMLDSDSDGRITDKDLVHFLRWTGQNPSTDEVKKMIKTITKETKESISFSDYLSFMKNPPIDLIEEYETMKEAFKIFDRHGSGLVSVKDIAHILQKMGENFTENQINDVLKLGIKKNNGYIEFPDFLKLMNFKVSPNLLILK